MRTVITYGTFDLFHIGHLRLLMRARALGDRLIVGVSSDSFNSIKGKRSFFCYEDRASIVSAIAFVDAVFPENTWDQKRSDIEKYKADVFVMGSDWSGKFDDLNDIAEVRYLDRTEGISSTEIKTALQRIDNIRLEELRSAANLVLDLINGIR